MKIFLEQGYGVVLVGIVTGASLLSRWILLVYYTRLGKACREFGKTKNKTITYIRSDLEQRVKLKLGIKSAMIYTECRLAECKLFGIRLGVFEAMSEQSLLLILLSGVLSAFAGVLWECSSETVVFLLFVSGITTFGVITFDLFAGLREKHKRVRLSIRDYIENLWTFGVYAQNITEQPEQMQKGKQKKERIRKVSKEKVRNAKVKTKCMSAKRHGKAQEEKRRLTEELLRERRQMEARQFAQERKKERVVKETELLVQAEAAVTETLVPETVESTTPNMPEIQPELLTKSSIQESSYETLLCEVLTEYLT